MPAGAPGEPGFGCLTGGVMVVCREPVERELAVALLRALGVGRVLACGGDAAAISQLATLQPPPALALLDGTPQAARDALLQWLYAAAVPVVLIRASPALDGNVVESSTAAPVLASLPLDGRALYNALCQVLHGAALPTTRPPAEMQYALAAGRLAIDYLPRVTLASGEIDGVEATPRLSLPGRDVPATALLAGAAEGADRWAYLLDAMAAQLAVDMASWNDRLPALPVSLGLAPANLAESGLAERVLAILGRHGIAPARVMLEIAESALALPSVSASDTLGRLHRAGARLVITHYGRGSLSVQRLARLPIAAIAIHPVLVTGAQTSAALRSMLATSVTIGARLGLATIAMGIDTAEQLAMLQALGCSAGTGACVGGPLRADEVPGWRMRGHSPTARPVTRSTG